MINLAMLYFQRQVVFQICRTMKRVFAFKGDKALFKSKSKPNPNYTIMIWATISKKWKIFLKFFEGKLNLSSNIVILK